MMLSKEMLQRLLSKQLSRSLIPQSFHTYNHTTHAWTSSSTSLQLSRSPSPLTSLTLINWNIDFQAPCPHARMASALTHLSHIVSTIPPTSAILILLQEMQEGPLGAQDLSQIAATPWVQSRFHVTDLDAGNWRAHYGQVTLVDRRLAIKQVSRLHLVSEFQRDALVVDVKLNAVEHDEQMTERILRVCNVHLDSLTGDLRPIQWAGIAKHLQNTSANVAASLLAGDCNANRPRDWIEPMKNEFTDSYLELGGVEGDEEGCTWGFQSKGWERFGRSRMDKQVFWGGVRVSGLERMGVGVEVEDVLARKELEESGKGVFVTDHYGLAGRYEVEGGFEVSLEKGGDENVMGVSGEVPLERGR